MTESRELGLRLPILGVQLIEASAGTGKTFAVATLYLRLVIELHLPVSRLLAVTYTEAAAKDLRDKLRERLARASEMLEKHGAGGGDARAGADSAEASSRLLLREALARGETLPALRQRLRVALAAMDLAPIHTIHGFCQRALREHALEAGRPLGARTLVTNEAALRREVATEFWRRQSREADAVESLLGIWRSPAELAEALPDLLSVDALEPAREPVDMRAARDVFAAAFATHGEDAHAALVQAFECKDLKATIRKPELLDTVWRALWRWAQAPLEGDPRADRLGDYGAASLAAETMKSGITPANPFFEAIDAFLAARLRARTAMVHDARDFAATRLAELKRERQLIGFDDLIRNVADALEGAHAEVLTRALQRQYAVGLVDEFQDTDPRQWRIFRTLFAQPAADDGEVKRALFLIGDPKQAIYRFRGGDVETYLVAQQEAVGRHRLERNFRSRPLALQAVAALFGRGGGNAFDTPGIEFEAVAPGGACRDEHFRRHGADAPALHIHAIPAGQYAEDARQQCAANCVHAIHALLSDARAGQAELTVRQPDGSHATRPVRPGDISVLVGRNKDGLLMQRALSEAGIPSVAAGRSSLYDSEEARDVRAWLAALAAPADDGRLRALLATPLFGLDAAAIAAFDTDLARHRHWQDALQHWLAQAGQRGPMSALAAACALESARILAQAGGERRLSNYLQLVEELQAAETGANGIAGLLAELERRIEDADERNDAELTRLESDAARVRIMTTHVSKGLNLDLVFVPFAALGGAGSGGRQRKPRMARRHRGLSRVGKLVQNSADPACTEEAREAAAENIRVLYVALTRARYATWIGWGACKEALKTALGWLLHRDADGKLPPPKKFDADVAQRALEGLQASAPQAIALLPAVDPALLATLPRLSFQSAKDLPSAREVRRRLDRDWWVYSFSQLAREERGAEERGAEDEAGPTPLVRSRFSGTRFGNALHGALEAIRFADWRDFRGPMPPTGQLEPLQEALRREGFASEADLEEGVPLLSLMIGETLNTAMPEGTQLAALPAESLCVEMEFHFQLAPVAVSEMLALLHAHGVVPARREFGLRQRLEGLLTGRIDLVYEAGGRFYVLDYKSNQLADYGADTVARAVEDHEYDLQYVIYTLALHRWLRFRLGAAYDIGTHLGGVRYLFCRGLEREDPAAPGIHALRLPDALVLQLDALLQRREAA